MESVEELISTGVAADMLGVTPYMIRCWQQLGKITAEKLSPMGHRRYLRSDIEKLQAEEHGNANELIGAGVAADILGATRYKLLDWQQLGYIRVEHTLGGQRRYRRSDIEKFKLEGMPEAKTDDFNKGELQRFLGLSDHKLAIAINTGIVPAPAVGGKRWSLEQAEEVKATLNLTSGRDVAKAAGVNYPVIKDWIRDGLIVKPDFAIGTKVYWRDKTAEEVSATKTYKPLPDRKEKGLVSLSKIAGELGISMTAIQHHLKRGMFEKPSVRSSGGYYYTPEQAEEVKAALNSYWEKKNTLVSVCELARGLGITVDCMRNHIRRGRIPAPTIRHGVRVCYTLSEAEDVRNTLKTYQRRPTKS